jgi:Fe-S cluster assembly protein SufD
MEALAQATGLDLYHAAFERFEDQHRDEAPWLRKLRREAMAQFLDLGFPTAKAEAWKYTNLRPITQTAWTPASGILVRPVAGARIAFARIPGATEVVFVNGRFVPELSSLHNLERGVRVSSLRESASRRPEVFEAAVGKICPIAHGAFVALNTALFPDGVCLEIEPGTVVPAPIHLLFVSAEEDGPALSSPRVLVLAGRQSQATVVETYVGEKRAVAFTNAVTEISVGDAAVMEHYKVQQDGAGGYHVHAIAARQDRASSFTSHNLELGGALARTDIDVLFTAEGSECSLNGLFVGSGSQHLDTHTVIDHAQPHCTSRELYKGILDGKSRGVFHGTIIVRPDAQKTDAMQTNKNLLLSREALVDSTPALEIRADDVKCRHGSTIGQLDAGALFYLQSRGIGEEEARALLTYAFAADLTERIRLVPIRERIEAFLGQALSEPREPGLGLETP